MKNDLVYSQQLDDMTISSSMFSHTVIVVSDISIKNNITTSVLYIHIQDNLLIKIVHYVAYVTSTEIELFTIRYRLSQACNKENISKIIVVTNFIYMTKKIFDTKSHSYQIYMIAILNELWQFFTTCQRNHIEFWKCPSQLKWNLYKSTNKDSKSFKLIPVLPSKIS